MSSTISITHTLKRGRRGHDRIVVGFTTCCLSPLMLWVWISRCTTLCDKVCQWLETGRWFSLGFLVSLVLISQRSKVKKTGFVFRYLKYIGSLQNLIRLYIEGQERNLLIVSRSKVTVIKHKVFLFRTLY